jgi:hypothetical protein
LSRKAVKPRADNRESTVLLIYRFLTYFTVHFITQLTDLWIILYTRFYMPVPLFIDFLYSVIYWSRYSRLNLGLITPELNLWCFHPVACVRSGHGGFYIRRRKTKYTPIGTKKSRHNTTNKKIAKGPTTPITYYYMAAYFTMTNDGWTGMNLNRNEQGLVQTLPRYFMEFPRKTTGILVTRAHDPAESRI